MEEDQSVISGFHTATEEDDIPNMPGYVKVSQDHCRASIAEKTRAPKIFAGFSRIDFVCS
jgi:hypothetical protein